jgi:hypothetical protein
VVFDMSERFPDAVIGVAALLVALAMIALALLPAGRSLLRNYSWVCLGGGGLLWIAFEIHNTGGPTSLVFASVGVVAVGLAYLARSDSTIGSNDKAQRVKPVAPFLAVGVLLLVGLCGIQQLSAFGLAGRLTAGEATVTTGPVTKAMGFNWAYQCFSVGEQRFCYDDGPTSVGFHQSTNNGGPIRDGLQVRVTSIGSDIVRLEIADGQ